MKNETLLKFAEKTIKANNKKYTTAKNEFMGLSSDSWVIRDNSTRGMWEKFNAGAIGETEIKTHAYGRYIAKREKDLKKSLENAKDVIENGAEVKNVRVHVDWVRSRTWGFNPHATVNVATVGDYETFEGSASGCGYDKRSAATAQAFNACKALRRLLWEIAYKERNSDKTYGYNVFSAPHFEGGVGFSCHRHIFEKMGFKCEMYDESVKNHDVYYFTK